jgi:uncharacterized radical SAM superfamily protein
MEAKGKDLDALNCEGFSVARRRFGAAIHFYAPGMVHFESTFHVAVNSMRFPAISVTGRSCHLQCEHCKGRLLEEMIPAPEPEALFKAASDVKRSGGSGMLISGGSDIDGGVPLDAFIPTIRRIKTEIGIEVVVHTGLIKREMAAGLASAGIDAAMIDIIGSDETYRRVYHVSDGLASIEGTMGAFEAAGVGYVPHIVVGIDGGAIKGEANAVELVAGHNPLAVVVVGLMPLENTPMCNVTPPSPEDVARVVVATRLAVPGVPLLLGCARSKGDAKSRLDVLAIGAGVNGIAYPSEEGYEYAVARGLHPSMHDECCALLYKHVQGA